MYKITDVYCGIRRFLTANVYRLQCILMIINRKWTKWANFIEPLFYIIFSWLMKHHVIITIYCEPYTPANESETLQQLMDQKRELVLLSLFKCRWEAECSGCGVRSNPLLADWMDADHVCLWEVWQPQWTAWLAPRWRHSTSPNLPA